jgi:prepilin-type N-terminal cleavage/methylation domain-containing protein
LPVIEHTKSRRAEVNNRQHGFTLLEMLVVLTLISIMLAISVPRFRNSLFTDPLSSSARQIIATVREARQQALQSDNGCFIITVIEEKKLELSCPDSKAAADEEQDRSSEDQSDEETTTGKSIILPEETRIESIYNGRGQRYATGTVRLWINPRGLMEPAIFNLISGDDSIGMSFSPFLPEVRMADQAIEPDDAGGSL